MYLAIQNSDIFECNLKVWFKFEFKRFITCKYSNTLTCNFTYGGESPKKAVPSSVHSLPSPTSTPDLKFLDPPLLGVGSSEF